METILTYWLKWKLNIPFEVWPKNEEKVSKVSSAERKKYVTA
jgi:hypothetical protein